MRISDWSSDVCSSDLGSRGSSHNLDSPLRREVAMVRTRLGIDQGTNSLGWCLYDLDEHGEACGIRDIGVRIFSDGRDPKSGASLAVDRRNARAMRRRRDRHLRRRSALLQAPVENGLGTCDAKDGKGGVEGKEVA